VAELKDPRREAMARMMAQGMSAVEAHRKAGFRTSRRKDGNLDTGNASKKANELSMIARVNELRSADASRMTPLRGKTGVDIILEGIEMARQADKPGEIIRGGIALAMQDGSFGELNPVGNDERLLPDAELLRRIARLTGQPVETLSPLIAPNGFAQDNVVAMPKPKGAA
jgi:hypothetical protein